MYFLLRVIIPNDLIMTGAKVCECCFKKCSDSLQFRNDSLNCYKQQIETKNQAKRLSKTPPSTLKKQNKNTVAENLKNSVKKIKTSNVEGKSGSKAIIYILHIYVFNVTDIR